MWACAEDMGVCGRSYIPVRGRGRAWAEFKSCLYAWVAGRAPGGGSVWRRRAACSSGGSGGARAVWQGCGTVEAQGHGGQAGRGGAVPLRAPPDTSGGHATPPRTPSPAEDLDLASLIFIDTTPTPVPDAPAPPARRGAARHPTQNVEVVEVPDTPPGLRRSRGSDSDIAVVYEGPRQGRGGTRRAQPPALAPAEEDQHGEVEVVEQEPRSDAEVEVIEVDTVEDHHHHQRQQQQQQQQEEEKEEEEDEEGEEREVVDSDSDNELGGGGGSNSAGGQVLDSDNEGDASSSSSSSAGGTVVDVSGEDFVSLGAVPVRRLNNTTIDLSDEVLRRRRHLEALRPGSARRWGTTWRCTGCSAAPCRSPCSATTCWRRACYGTTRSCTAAVAPSSWAWEYRWALLQHEVEALRPDVLLLQEASTRRGRVTRLMGCAIFYHGGAWRLAEHTSVEYRQPRAPAVLDRDNVGIIARLVPRHGGGGGGSSSSSSSSSGGGAGVVVATTHLLYNPRRHDVKLAQAAVLLAELDRMCYAGQVAGQPQYCPVVLAGDLNAEPHSALLSFLLEGRLQYEGLGRRTLTRHYSHGPELGPQLLPPALGITGACQHAALAQGRWLERQRGPIISPADKRRLEEALIHLQHSDRPGAAPAMPVTTALHDPAQCPGWLTHALLLHSAYRHQRRGRGGGGTDVTTFPGAEGPLKLLERLTLPTAREAALFSPMPSPVCPSDHFPLAARFMLLHT
ncbi:hypothetical protein O3P69_019696 [Scylla paramamosain]|uniref:Endonuclease/exonuclease/phosphatase domain-containing protein n=1 Tax=Scylla paramamosain TaxID=85552 RepID=A0AAW0T0Z4_SCYPA